MSKILAALIVGLCCVMAAQADVTIPGVDLIRIGTMQFKNEGVYLTAQNADGTLGRLGASAILIGDGGAAKSSITSTGGGFSTQGAPINNTQIYAGLGNRFRVTQTRPEIHGPCVMLDNDLTFLALGMGPVIPSPNGTKYRIVVDNAGALATQLVP